MSLTDVYGKIAGVLEQLHHRCRIQGAIDARHRRHTVQRPIRPRQVALRVYIHTPLLPDAARRHHCNRPARRVARRILNR